MLFLPCVVQEALASPQKKRNSDSEDEDEVFVGYSPQRIKVDGWRWVICCSNSCPLLANCTNGHWRHCWFTFCKQVAELRKFDSNGLLPKEAGTYKVALKPHPTQVVESKCFRAVQAPPPSYNPALSPKLISDGSLSDIQYESVVYAGMRHSQILGDGTRAAYFIGDGTGIGKGRQMAAIILVRFWSGADVHVVKL